MTCLVKHHAKWKTLFADEPKTGKQVVKVSANHMSLYRAVVY